MKNLFFIILFSFLFNPSYAQLSSYDDKPVWNVAEILFGTPQLVFSNKFEFFGKINFCNKTYSMMAIPKWSKTDTLFFRNEGKKTFIRFKLDCASKEFLFYDFGLKVGETAWVVSAKANDSMQVKLLSIKDIKIGFSNFETYNLECSFKNSAQKRSMVWVDKIGCLYHPLYYYQVLPPLVDGSSFELMCYSDKNGNNYEDPKYPDCKVLPYNYKPFPLFKDKPIWEVIENSYYNGPPTQSEYYQTISYQKDTFICGIKYSKSTANTKNIYVRNVGKSTFCKLIPDCNSPEILLYSFDFPDYLSQMPMTDPNSSKQISKFTLDDDYPKFDTMLINGKKYFTVVIKQGNYQETWIEGVGSPKHPFEILANRAYINIADGPFWKLTCMKDNNTQYSAEPRYNCNSDFKPFPLYKDNPLWSELATLPLNGSGGGSSKTFKMNYKNKSNFCGKEYSLVEYDTYKMYLRNEGKKTYFRLSQDCSDKEYLLYDFDMKVGDKKYFPMQIKNTDIDSSLFTLKKIDTIWHYYQKVRRFYYDFEYYKPANAPAEIKTMVLQEGVGSLWHPFFPVQALWRSKVDGPNFELLCTDVPSYAYYRKRYDLKCDINSIATNDLDDSGNQWLISPNPFDENISISNDESEEKTKVLIVDLNGKIIYQTDFQNATNINTANFSKGIYFIQLKNKETQTTRKLIKM
jgi:Secretion system C-terminal sorting domain